MTDSPDSDIDRVLNRMGSATIGYHTFSTPPLDPGGLVPEAMFAVEPEEVAGAAPSGALFGLIAAALPETVTTDADLKTSPVVLGDRPMTFAAPAPTSAPADNWFKSLVRAAPNPPPVPHSRTGSLSEMFRMLSGAADSSVKRDATFDSASAFPFRRG